MKTKKYTYYSIFLFDKESSNAISIEFPDLPGCLSCAYNYSKAKKNAREALILYLHGMNADDIPASNYIKIKNECAENSEIIKITVKMREKDGKLVGKGVKQFKSNFT